MSPPNWEIRFTRLVYLSHIVHGVAFTSACAFYFFLPPDATRWNPDLHPIVFYMLLALSVLSILVNSLAYPQLMSYESLDMRRKGVGFDAAVESFSYGVMLSACLGDICATLGMAFYAISREPNRLWIFVGFWGIHYIFTTIWLRKGREDLERLSRLQANIDSERAKNAI